MQRSKINFENKNFVCNFEQKIAIIIYIVAEIVKKIEESQDVQALSLEGNTLGVEAAKAIAQALSKRKEFEV